MCSAHYSSNFTDFDWEKFCPLLKFLTHGDLHSQNDLNLEDISEIV